MWTFSPCVSVRCYTQSQLALLRQNLTRGTASLVCPFWTLGAPCPDAMASETLVLGSVSHGAKEDLVPWSGYCLWSVPFWRTSLSADGEGMEKSGTPPAPDLPPQWHIRDLLSPELVP